MPTKPPQLEPDKTEKKPNNIPWLVAIVLLLGPAVFLAWNIIVQPPGNQVFYNMNRPDVGVSFDIVEADVIDDELTMTVTYSGGCENHTFDLYIEDQQSDINRLLELHHQSEDTCTTKVTEDLMYDLSSVIEEHDSAQIVFTVSGNGAEPEPILYEVDTAETPS